MAEPKKYVRGSAKEKVFENGSKLLNFSININDKQIVDHAKDGWVQLVISEKREVDQYGNSHYIYLNEFQPKKKAGKKEESKEEDLPF